MAQRQGTRAAGPTHACLPPQEPDSSGSNLTGAHIGAQDEHEDLSQMLPEERQHCRFLRLAGALSLLLTKGSKPAGLQLSREGQGEPRPPDRQRQVISALGRWSSAGSKGVSIAADVTTPASLPHAPLPQTGLVQLIFFVKPFFVLFPALFTKTL